MAEFFGALERLAADLYPWRYVIGAAVLLALAGLGVVAYLRGWHLWVWQRRVPVSIVGTPLLALAAFLAYDLGSPLFTNLTIEEEFPYAFSAAIDDLDLGDRDLEDVDNLMKLIAMVDQEVVEEAMPDMAPQTEVQAPAQLTAPPSLPPALSPPVAAVPATAPPARATAPSAPATAPSARATAPSAPATAPSAPATAPPPPATAPASPASPGRTPSWLASSCI